MHDTCAEGQTPSLQPAEVVLMQQQEDFKLDCSGRGKERQRGMILPILAHAAFHLFLNS